MLNIVFYFWGAVLAWDSFCRTTLLLTDEYQLAVTSFRALRTQKAEINPRIEKIIPPYQEWINFDLSFTQFITMQFAPRPMC